MSCTSPATVPITILPAALACPAFRCGLIRSTAFFITSADFSTNGNCSTPSLNSRPTSFIATIRWSLRTSSAAIFASSAGTDVSSSAALPLTSAAATCSSGVWAAPTAPASASGPAASKCWMNCSSGSPSAASLSSSFSASLTAAGAKSVSGTSVAVLMMHASSPALTQRSRNTVLSTLRAGGFRPNETFDSPSSVRTPANSFLMRRMAAMVSLAASRSAPSPLHTVNVSASISRSPRRKPRFSQNSIRRWAIATLRSAVMAMPVSSIVSATSAAPKRRASATSCSAFSSPASKLIELTSRRPP